MLKWREPLLVHPPMKDKEGIIKKCNRGVPVHGYYLVTLSQVKGNRLEILPCALLWQKEFFRTVPFIVGLAKGKRAAMELAAVIELDYDCFLPGNP